MREGEVPLHPVPIYVQSVRRWVLQRQIRKQWPRARSPATPSRPRHTPTSRPPSHACLPNQTLPTTSPPTLPTHATCATISHKTRRANSKCPVSINTLSRQVHNSNCGRPFDACLPNQTPPTTSPPAPPMVCRLRKNFYINIDTSISTLISTC